MNRSKYWLVDLPIQTSCLLWELDYELMFITALWKAEKIALGIKRSMKMFKYEKCVATIFVAGERR